MRTALALLFLLALGALPGALLPQRSLNAPKVGQYITEHGWWGRVLDKLQFYDVYGSVWFAAIYVLLFVSLVGCLVPRSVEYARQSVAKPVLTPRNLGRMPHYATSTVDASPADVLAAVRPKLRGWRAVEREEDGGARSISAERGFLRETGNLLFHFALLGLLVAYAVGKMYGYEGQVIVQADGSQFCNSGVLNYDSFRPGLRVDGTQLDPFCVKVNGFTARYLPDGQAESYQADVQYQSGADLETNTWKPYDLRVNSPLRTAGDRVYLLGNGYSPVFTVTFPNGQQRTGHVQWEPVDQQTKLSQGATKFDPPDVTDPVLRRQQQIAVTGLFAPTAVYDGKVLSSGFPALTSPAVAVQVYRGDLGTDSGRGQSIFSVDHQMIADGRLKKVASQNLGLGQQLRLDDGTTVRFDGVVPWVNLQVSHDPTQDLVLVFAILIIGGLVTSLTVKRRRVWVRATPESGAEGGGRTVVEVGGLARTDQAGYGEEFTRLSGELLAAPRQRAEQDPE
ncbi:cytochrome c biogenesis protein ResB [Gandjariella thermophila]|nr:cytochrome c biogenesis protein ResB [Gandjariella thermophila]